MGFSSFPSLYQFSKSLCLERSFFKGIHDWFSLRDSPGYQTLRHYAPFTLVLGPCPRAFLHPLACFFRSASFYGCPFSLSHSLCVMTWEIIEIIPWALRSFPFCCKYFRSPPHPVSFPYFPSHFFVGGFLLAWTCACCSGISVSGDSFPLSSCLFTLQH